MGSTLIVLLLGFLAGEKEEKNIIPKLYFSWNAIFTKNAPREEDSDTTQNDR